MERAVLLFQASEALKLSDKATGHLTRSDQTVIASMATISIISRKSRNVQEKKSKRDTSPGVPIMEYLVPIKWWIVSRISPTCRISIFDLSDEHHCL
ncbi:hypothetical protein EAE99_009417 [Botrytis elliptica]|nr:hypothetical protein EAE99_009417 [Botrytis elliptica]